MHNSGYVQENDTRKVLSDFDIKADDLISARRPGLIVNKKNKLAKLSTLLSRLTTEKTESKWKEG